LIPETFFPQKKGGGGGLFGTPQGIGIWSHATLFPKIFAPNWVRKYESYLIGEYASYAGILSILYTETPQKLDF
jgi:hypothetical protein